MKAVLLGFAICLFCVAASAQRQTPDLSTYKSDKCTLFPDGDYADCCIAHDREYFVGGSLKERLASDKRLRQCVKSKGRGWKRKLLANVIFLGVRIGGVHWLPTPFRWGFGNKWPRMRPPKSSIPVTNH